MNTSLALAHANSHEEFIYHLKQLGYRNGEVGYLSRNHFTSLDWNLNNSEYLQDITSSIVDKDGDPIVQRSTAIIDKRAWFKHKKVKDLSLPNLSSAEKHQRLQRLHQSAESLEPEHMTIHYIPLSALFNKYGKPDTYIFDQIPHGAVIEIVRPNWQLKNKIGTNLHISHLGFAMRKPNQPLLFRQASTTFGKVMELSLATYLKAYIKSPTVKGIMVLVPKSV